MSYRLIDANELNGKISAEDYEVVLKEPCIYADLPNGMDGKGYEVISWEKIPKDATNGDVIKAMFSNCYCKQGQDINDLKGDFATIVLAECVDFFFGGILMMRVDRNWWNAKYKGG